MTTAWDRITATGSGQLAWRVSIEGYPVEWVTHDDMVSIKRWGVTDFSSVNYYYMPATNDLDGSATMTRSVLFRYDSATGAAQRLFENYDAGTGGYILQVGAAGTVDWVIYDAGGPQTVQSAALTVGETYCVTVTWNGTTQRVVLNQVATSGTPGITYVPATSSTPALGAFHSGGSTPASGCTIFGAAASDTAALSEAAAKTHNAACIASGRMEGFTGVENVWRAPELETDIHGSLDWTVVGSPASTRITYTAWNSGRERAVGLSSQGFKFGQKVDLVTGAAEGSTFRVKINNPKKGAEVFGKRPTNVTHLTSNETSTATTIRCKGATAFATSGKAHVNTETFAYTATDTTGFLGCSRGQWDTLAQYHYTSDGDRLRYPEITDHPVVLEGRRVRFYAYAPGDDRTGDGTLVWVGIASTDASFNGVSWSFQCDSLFRLLDQDVGSDITDPVPIRGIYYPSMAPLYVEIVEKSGANHDSSTARTAKVALAGFWESNADFVDALNTAIAAELTAQSFTQTDFYAVEIGESWGFEYTTGSPSPLYMRASVTSAVDAIDPVRVRGDFGEDSDRGAPSVSASTTYWQIPADRYPAGGTVPRAIFGGWRPAAAKAAQPDCATTGVDGTYPPFRVYVGGGAGVTSNTSYAAVDWTSPDVDWLADAYSGTAHSSVSAVDASERFITMTRPPFVLSDGSGGFAVAVASSVPTVRMGRDYGAGTLATFLGITGSTGLVDQTAQYVNTGAVPYLRPATGSTVAGDLHDSSTEISAAASAHPFTATRHYTSFAEVSLKDMIEHECRLIGCHPLLITGTQGSEPQSVRIGFKRLRLPSPADVSGTTVTASVTLTDDQILSWERAALGIYNTVLIRTGYDPQEEEHRGDTYKVRDVAAFGQSPNSRVLEIAPMSGDPSGTIDYRDMVDIGARTLAIFGGPYVFMSVEVPLTLWGTEPGDIVSITWSKVPESDGTLGVTNKLALVTAVEFEPMEARGMLTVMMTDQRVAGYAPSAVITSEFNSSGNTWSLTLDSTDFPSLENADDHFAAGDKIRVFRIDSTSTPGTITGTVSSVVANSIIVDLDSAWTPSTHTWALGFQVSTSITADGQKVYAFISKTDGQVDWSGDADNPPFTFAP